MDTFIISDLSFVNGGGVSNFCNKHRKLSTFFGRNYYVFTIFITIVLLSLLLYSIDWSTKIISISKVKAVFGSQSSKPTDREVDLWWQNLVTIPPAPSILFDPELGDLAQRLLDPPISSLIRPLQITILTGLKGPFGRIAAGDRVLIDSACSVPPAACTFSEERSPDELSSADVLLWQNGLPNNAKLSSFNRPRHQLWAWLMYEPPFHTGWRAEIFNGRLNWTGGYRLDSTLPDPYERYITIEHLERLLRDAQNWPEAYLTRNVRKKVVTIRNYIDTGKPIM